MLSSSAKTLIKCTIEERLMFDPVAFGKPLRYSLKGHRRLRVSDYRIIYRIEQETSTVIIIAIKHRKEIYQEIKQENIAAMGSEFNPDKLRDLSELFKKEKK